MIDKLFHYSHALEKRFFQLFELSILKRDGVKFGAGFSRKVWKNPNQTEDWVNLARFLRPNEFVLLLDIGANVGKFASDFLSIYNNSRVVCFEPVVEVSLIEIRGDEFLSQFVGFRANKRHL